MVYEKLRQSTRMPTGFHGKITFHNYYFTNIVARITLLLINTNTRPPVSPEKITFAISSARFCTHKLLCFGVDPPSPQQAKLWLGTHQQLLCPNTLYQSFINFFTIKGSGGTTMQYSILFSMAVVQIKHVDVLYFNFDLRPSK